MIEEAKTPIGIKIISVAMLLGSLCVVFWFSFFPLLVSVFISLLFITGSIELWRRKKWKPIVIILITGLIFIGNLYVGFWQIGFWYEILEVVRIVLIPVIISFLFIIGGIGLWKMKKWGLIVSCLALGGVILLSTIQAIIWLIRKEVPGIISANYLAEIAIHCCPPFFATAIVLSFLWMKRKCFYK